MSETKNRVKFNLKRAHYAKITFGSDGTATFGTPVAMPGAVSLSLDANGEPEIFWADGIAYYTTNNNMGYSGDVEMALIPQSFREDILHEEADSNGVLVERSDTEIEHFAFLFEFDGDQRHIRHVLYNCTASRPKMEGSTNNEKKEVKTETLHIDAVPLPNGIVKSKTGDATSTEAYNNWYSEVYEPVAEQTTGGETTGEG